MAFILDSIDSGSNYKFGDKLQKSCPPRSMFDLSHLHTTTIDNAGSLIPICLIETLPDDTFDISVNSLVRVLPQVVPLYSKQRLYIHGFYSSMSSLWINAQTFMTKGYSGNVLKSIPSVPTNVGSPSTETIYQYLGLPSIINRNTIGNFNINALPFMMYERIYRDYYMNRNFYINDRKVLPDNDGDYRLDDDGKIVSYGEYQPLLGRLRYRDFPQDYFTSALPFPQRGDTPSIDFDLVYSNLKAQWANNVRTFQGSSFIVEEDHGWSTLEETSGSPYLKLPSGSYSDVEYGPVNNKEQRLRHKHTFPTAVQTLIALKEDLNDNNITGDVTGNFSITLEMLRQLAVAQTELEKMARTDGSYAEFGLTFYGRVSKGAISYKPIYIGGAYESLIFSEVLQTSESSSTSPLGTYAGHGIAASRDGYIGKVNCDDYGYIMLIASIMPDVYYFQGLELLWSKKYQSDMFLPDRVKLGLVPILQQELYLSTDAEANATLFAYQDPFDEFRYRPNRISGKIADPNNLSFFPYTQARYFTSAPTYSQSFTIADKVRKDYLAAPIEVAYSAQFHFNIRAVRPLPYRAIPASII